MASSSSSGIWALVSSVKRTVWQPAKLPYPALWLLTRALFVPSVFYNCSYYWLMGLLGKKRTWWNKITDDVILGAMPMWWQFDTLQSLRVGAFVNLIEEFGGHLTQWGEIERRHLRELYIPTPDYIQPSLADVEKAILFIEQAARDGVVTYVHCKAGKGRAPTIVLCYLMKHKNMTPREAQDFIAERRPQISKDLYQRSSVIEYHRRLMQLSK
jgi:atypical dual specificity phosphatase